MGRFRGVLTEDYLSDALYYVLILITVILVTCTFLRPVRAEPAPYQVYRISYGCLYVASNATGGIAMTVTPSVGGDCR
jgi:hypothetical protein